MRTCVKENIGRGAAIISACPQYNAVFRILKYCRAGGIPKVLTIHNTPLIPERLFGTFKNYESEKAFTRQLFSNNRYDRLLLGSQYYLDAYAHAAPWIKEDHKTKVLHYFPPRITKGPMQSVDIRNTSATVNILFPSRILQRKGIEEALKVIALLPNHFHLMLPSFHSSEDSIYQTRIVRMIATLGIRHRVTIPPTVTTPEMMPDYYRQADIVLIPSHYEGFGIVALEAMSWGVPVVATAVGGLTEIIEDGKNGLLVEPKDLSAINNAINRIVSDTVLKKTIITEAINTVQNRFSRTAHMHQIENIYHEVAR